MTRVFHFAGPGLWLLVLLLALLTAGGGCASKQDHVWPRRVDGLRGLHVGMNKQQVLMELGDPDATRASGRITYLCYQLPMRDASKRDAQRKGVWYFIKHEDNLVIKFGPATAEDNCG
ncbi:hypothetical protein [Megalodesulfovibrio gigas]|uniref:Lipoprotein SmpA/OmlA domain-containing protein n=1 Tax=Megalodesulfovibrio gigas (strain ATCC 19364 / DSM 1382 / NCIMB 9332 / VKM B-1759) TaxID=1121448 RepID=T2GCS7_MEGG1|nr:hypothetical protein [Megalodesulfovibrio gigas]AGW14083.1 hypothetical protein DGI_2330 [Megalodesulfovibrio gigas DSM 1382 = ATCC 19364]